MIGQGTPLPSSPRHRSARTIRVVGALLVAILAVAGLSLTSNAAADHGGNHELRVVRGTGGKTPLSTNSPRVHPTQHGTRIYCTISHFNYDDPIVYPGQVGAAHLHMFWGNTATDAHSTRRSILNQGRTTCEGGINNRSAYWTPALFNENGQPVLPESLVVYYKSFASTSDFDRRTVKRIPNGLQMLASSRVAHSDPSNFQIESAWVDGQRVLLIKLTFPNCLRVRNGKPVLKSHNNTSHLAYGSSFDNNRNNCPNSHPWRIPQLSYHIRYDVPIESGWYLASDTSAATQGQSLHGDYIAGWDRESMRRLVLCNRRSLRNCQFESRHANDRLQLPGRFRGPEGRIYETSTKLLNRSDRTPFDRRVAKSLHG